MPLTIEDLIADPARLSELQPPADACAHCGQRLEETVTGRHETPDGIFCSDDYFDRFGAALEEHPIVSGAIRRR